jgi:hypothetical protein
MNKRLIENLPLQYVHLFVQEAEDHEGVWGQVMMMIRGQASRGSACNTWEWINDREPWLYREVQQCLCLHPRGRNINENCVYIFFFSERVFVWAKAEKINKKRRGGIWLEFGHFSIQKILFVSCVCSYNGELRKAVWFCKISVAVFPAPITCRCSTSFFSVTISLYWLLQVSRSERTSHSFVFDQILAAPKSPKIWWFHLQSGKTLKLTFYSLKMNQNSWNFTQNLVDDSSNNPEFGEPNFQYYIFQKILFVSCVLIQLNCGKQYCFVRSEWQPSLLPSHVVLVSFWLLFLYWLLQVSRS